MPRPEVKNKATTRDGKKQDPRYQAPEKKVFTPTQLDVPDRMHILFKSAPDERWLVLTPKEYNKHVGYFIAVPVTIEKTRLNPYEYSFVFERQTLRALCDQPQSIKLAPPYMTYGRLSKQDHVCVTKLLLKVIGESSLASKF